MKIIKTNNDNAAEPESFVAGTKFLQIEPAQVSDLGLMSVSGRCGSGSNDTVVERQH